MEYIGLIIKEGYILKFLMFAGDSELLSIGCILHHKR